ncbi:HNH endonuclease, partial [Gordonia sp. DT219]
MLAGIVDQLTELRTSPDMTGPQAHAALQQILLIRNLADHHAATFTGDLDRLGVADGHGRRLRELLTVMGCAPAVAARFVRIGTVTDVDPLRRHAADGSISSEHADAIVRGLTHIETRSDEPVDPDLRSAQLMSLMSWSSAGMTPAQIAEHARTIANELAAD